MCACTKMLQDETPPWQQAEIRRYRLEPKWLRMLLLLLFRSFFHECACPQPESPQLARQAPQCKPRRLIYKGQCLCTDPLLKKPSQAMPGQRSSDCQMRRAHGHNFQISTCNQLGQATEASTVHTHHLRQRAGQESASGSEFTTMKNGN